MKVSPPCINSAASLPSGSSVTLSKISNSFPCFTNICSSTDKEISQIRKSLKSAHLLPTAHWECLLVVALSPLPSAPSRNIPDPDPNLLVARVFFYIFTIFWHFYVCRDCILSCDTRLLASLIDMHLVYSGTVQKSWRSMTNSFCCTFR